jgi:hypothetical protein
MAVPERHRVSQDETYSRDLGEEYAIAEKDWYEVMCFVLND